MKIKVSKSQWIEMGNKTGWLKKAQIVPDDGYADGGTPYTDEELDIINKQENKPKFDKFYDIEKGDRGKVPKVDGYYLIKSYQMWGWCPTYRKIDGDKEDVLFYDQQTNKLLTWPEMKALLKETWRPAGREEQDWFVANLAEIKVSKSQWEEMGKKTGWLKKANFKPFPYAIFKYYINLDERGSFYADVRNSSGKTIFEIKAGNELGPNETDIFEDGFMENKYDLFGLKEYLISLGIMTENQSLVRGN